MPRAWVWWAVGVIVALVVGLVAGIGIGRGSAQPLPAAEVSTPMPTASASASPSASAVPTAPASAAPTPTAAAPVDSPAQVALAKLDGLVVADQRRDIPYDREADFGEPWIDVDGNGCRTRDDILARDLQNPTFTAGTCKVLSGVLDDPYSGATVDFVFGHETSQQVPIDHVVALAWAWRSGASSWTQDQRIAFANDPANLVATTEAPNQDKSDKGPSDWLPPAGELRCTFVVKWVTVLDAYRLSVDPSDKSAAADALGQC